MKKIYLAITLLFTVFFAQAQLVEPVKWSAAVEKISDTEYNLIYNATIEEHWHLYSQHLPEGGALPTEFFYDEEQLGKTFELVAKTAAESKTITKYDKVFEMDMTFFDNNATLVQRIKLLDSSVTSIAGEVSYQSCDDEKCLFDSKELIFNLSTAPLVTPANDTYIKLGGEGVKAAVLKESTSSKKEKESEKDGWSIFIATLLAGILVTFTPCVFPMIPMTVSFFLKHNGAESNSKGQFSALFYGFCIILIYVLISVPFHLFESLSPDIFNEISTNIYLNLFFFIIFIVFAISFLGAFEITMPSSLANKVDGASNKGGLIGVFFMALTLIIVSFSCTGPALGLVLGSVLSTDGGATLLSIAMFGFGLGLAFPFMTFALFPSLMKNMPKSGGWLNTVKVVFGFIELALAFKFLSNADLVLQLHYLEREVFLAIWIAIFGAMTLYLFGKIQLPHDSPIKHLSVGRSMLAVFTLAFTLYLVPGLWGAPLKLISGLPPSTTYSESPYGVGFKKLGGVSTSQELPEGADLAVHDIVSFHDYETGLAYAKKVGKPVLIDFTGYACVNCRKMEDNIWSEPNIVNKLKNDVVLISLYVDDKRRLPKEEQYISETTGKKIKTIGNKWSEFSIIRYKANVQPYYVLMDHDENNLIKPVGYTPDADEYNAWLKEGISKF